MQERGLVCGQVEDTAEATSVERWGEGLVGVKRAREIRAGVRVQTRFLQWDSKGQGRNREGRGIPARFHRFGGYRPRPHTVSQTRVLALLLIAVLKAMTLKEGAGLKGNGCIRHLCIVAWSFFFRL